jgi:DnaJ like chaperone protein
MVFSFMLFMIFTENEGLTSLFFAFVLGTAAFIGSITESKQKKKRIKKKYTILASDDLFSKYLLLLVAATIDSDKKKTQSELSYISKALAEHYSFKQVDGMVKFIEKSIEKGLIDIKKICTVIRHDYDIGAKVQLMHLLIGIATADGMLMKSEKGILKDIAMYMRIPFSTYTSLYKMFHFRHEGFEREKRRKSYSSSLRLADAYTILELDLNATVEQIKKAYRKMALKHHPDRVIQLGPDYQKSAKEKFQTISDAYEYIKDRKGFT